MACPNCGYEDKTLLTKRGVISSKHPIREQFAACSTGSNHRYYHTLQEGLEVFDKVLRESGLSLRSIPDCHNDTARALLVIEQGDEEVGNAFFTWYRMPSGNFEVIGYIT
jgi:hypothetical protein